MSGDRNIFIGPGANAGSLDTSDVLIISTGIEPSGMPLISGQFNEDRVEVNGELQVKETLNLQHVMRLTPLGSPPMSPETGTIYYNSGTNKVRVWTGAAWEDLN